MGKPLCSEADFVALFQTIGPTKLAERLNTSERSVLYRRRSIEEKRGISLQPPVETRKHVSHHPWVRKAEHPQRLLIDVPDGEVLVGGDGHYWPGPPSPAHRAFVKFAKKLNPKAIIVNGDTLDGATIKRHPTIGWEDNPPLVDEIETSQLRHSEIQEAAPDAPLFWTLGNHDMRFETRIATVAPEYARIHGYHLKDFFPAWNPCWSVWINDNVVVKHRYKGGLHATHNNTLYAGKTIVTNHLHSAKVTPLTDYNGTRYGVDTGCLADPEGPQFVHYTEDNPLNWRSAFCVLTFRGGRLMYPELVLRVDKDTVEFRGDLIHV